MYRREFIPPPCPLRVFHINHDTISDDGAHEHHDFYELAIFTGGSCRNETQDGVSHVSTGDVVLMKPRTVHQNAGHGICNYNVLFGKEMLAAIAHDLRCLPLWKNLFEYGQYCSDTLHLGNVEFMEAVRLLDELEQEYLSRRQGWQYAVQNGFGRLLLYLLRNAVAGKSRFAGTMAAVNRTADYMERHHIEHLTLAELAAHAGMSQSGFRTIFKKAFDVSPLDYLIRLRLRHAVLLFPQPLSLSEIALICGFSDSNYLARQFRRHYGCSPREFRMLHKKELITSR